jgi:hypothetical protein
MSEGKMETNRLTFAIMKVGEFELEIHYEKKLRESFHSVAAGEGTINSQDQWDLLTAMFLKHRLVSLDDVKRLDANMPSFPLTF